MKARIGCPIHIYVAAKIRVDGLAWLINWIMKLLTAIPTHTKAAMYHYECIHVSLISYPFQGPFGKIYQKSNPRTNPSFSFYH